MKAFVQCKERVFALRVRRTVFQTGQMLPVARRVYEMEYPALPGQIQGTNFITSLVD